VAARLMTDLSAGGSSRNPGSVADGSNGRVRVLVVEHVAHSAGDVDDLR
jgi:hypothetical protein